MTSPKVDLKNRWLAVVLAFLVPGAGHLYQRRIFKAQIYFFGILGMYILNLRFFTEQFTSLFTGGRFGGDYFFKLVSFMNLAACALNLATLTTRFVYPQFSLEGKRLWIVGLSPLGLSRVVKVKFMLASVISLLISLPLIWFSCRMLQLPIGQVLFFMGAISVMSIALNGLAVGMGVMYPNLKEDNPSKIVAGFGGTFCVKYSDISDHMVGKSIDALSETDAGVVLGGDLGCLMNIQGKLSRLKDEGKESNLKVRHVAEVLAGMTDTAPIGEANG